MAEKKGYLSRGVFARALFNPALYIQVLYGLDLAGLWRLPREPNDGIPDVDLLQSLYQEEQKTCRPALRQTAAPVSLTSCGKQSDKLLQQPLNVLCDALLLQSRRRGLPAGHGLVDPCQGIRRRPYLCHSTKGFFRMIQVVADFSTWS